MLFCWDNTQLSLTYAKSTVFTICFYVTINSLVVVFLNSQLDLRMGLLLQIRCLHELDWLISFSFPLSFFCCCFFGYPLLPCITRSTKNLNVQLIFQQKFPLKWVRVKLQLKASSLTDEVGYGVTLYPIFPCHEIMPFPTPHG